MAKVPSPCVGVCKFKLNKRCLGCAMTKKQKKKYKTLGSSKDKLAFITKLVGKQKDLGRHAYWLKVYTRKCAKKGLRPPVAA